MPFFDELYQKGVIPAAASGLGDYAKGVGKNVLAHGMWAKKNVLDPANHLLWGAPTQPAPLGRAGAPGGARQPFSMDTKAQQGSEPMPFPQVQPQVQDDPMAGMMPMRAPRPAPPPPGGAFASSTANPEVQEFSGLPRGSQAPGFGGAGGRMLPQPISRGPTPTLDNPFSNVLSGSDMAQNANAALSRFFGHDVGAAAGAGFDKAMQDEGIGQDMWQREHASRLNESYLQQAGQRAQLADIPRMHALQGLEAITANPMIAMTPEGKAAIHFYMQQLGIPMGDLGVSPGAAPGQPQPPTHPPEQGRGAAAAFGEGAIPGAVGALAYKAGGMIPGWPGKAVKFGGATLAPMLAGWGIGQMDPKAGVTMQEHPVASGLGALGGWMGGSRMMKGVGGLPPLAQAEEELNVGTGGKPTTLGTQAEPTGAGAMPQGPEAAPQPGATRRPRGPTPTLDDLRYQAALQQLQEMATQMGLGPVQ